MRVHGDFIIPADSLSTNLGRGLSMIAFEAGEWLEHLQLKQQAMGSIPGGCPALLAGLLYRWDEGSVVL